MYIRTPKLYCLKDFSCNLQDFEVSCLGSYGIGAPNINCLSWSLFMGYLFQLNNEEVYIRRFQNAFGSEGKNNHCTRIQNFFISYNPFQNRYKCVWDNTLKSLVSAFSRRVNECIMKILDSEILDVKLLRDDCKMQALCSMLECAIAVCDVEKKAIYIYPFGRQDSSEDSNIPITLYFRERRKPGRLEVSYGIAQKLGEELRLLTLKSELKKAGVHKSNIKQISRLHIIENNLIMTLVEAKMFDTVKYLLRQIPTLSKLEDAGYVVDPFVPDSKGKSSFHCALECVDEEIAFCLCNKAAKISPRNPDELVIKNLDRIRGKLKDIQKELPQHYVDSKICLNHELKIFRLIKFNEFQCDVSKALMALRAENNHSDTTSDALFNAEKSKRIITQILSIYQKYFCITDANERDEIRNGNNDEINGYSECIFPSNGNYLRHNKYYQILDFQTSLLFFNHLYSLKRKLVLDCTRYEEIESKMCRFIFSHKFYSELLIRRRRGFRHGSDNKLHHYVIFMERVRTNTHLQEFRKLLENTNIDCENTSGRPPGHVLTLSSLPDIRDVFILKRILHYIDLATKLDLEGYKLEGVLVIERALQVIGESIKVPSGSDSVSLGQSMLASCLPMHTAMDLRKIRDSLSHLENIQERELAEENTDMFVKIQRELKTIKERVKHTLNVISNKMLMYMITEDEKRMSDFNKTRKEEETAKKGELGDCPPEYSSNMEECKRTLEHERDRAMQRLKSNAIHSLNIYKEQIQVHFSFLQHYMDPENKRINFNVLKEKYIHFNCIHILINHLIEFSPMKRLEKEKFTNAFDTQNLEVLKLNENVSQDGILADMKHIFDYLKGKWDEFCLMLGTSKQRVLKEVGPFSSIGEMKRLLNTKILLSGEEKIAVLGGIDSKFKNSNKAKIFLQNALENEDTLPPEVVKREINNLILSERRRKELESDFDTEDCRQSNIDIISSVRDHYGTLEKAFFENTRLDRTVYTTICKDLELSPSAKKKLEIFVKGATVQKDPKLLQYLSGKIALFEKLIRNCNAVLAEQWSIAKSENALQRTLYGLKCHNLRNPTLQAATEMVFFDCMNVLKKRADFQDLWLKTSNLFNGINLRNVLAHGHPLFQCITETLNQDDLLTEIVSKIMELVNDLESIDAMCQIQEKSKASREEFCEIMKEEPNEYKDLCNKIKKCERWQSYSHLIHSKHRM